MSAAVDRTIDHMLDEAEAHCTFLIASSYAEQKWLHRRVQRENLVSPHPHVFARLTYLQRLDPAERHLHLIRTLALAHPRWIFTHTSAAIAHGLYVDWSLLERVHIAGWPRHNNPHVCRHWGDYQPCRINGVATSPLFQTMFDCLRTLPFAHALGIADSALSQLGISREHAGDLIRTSWGKHKGLQRALQTLAHANPASENGGESYVRARIIELGFTDPELQVELPDPLRRGATIRVDMLWQFDEGTTIALEVDGFQKYEQPLYMDGHDVTRVLLDERQRESRATLLVNRILRITPAQARSSAYLTRLLTSYGVPRMD